MLSKISELNKEFPAISLVDAITFAISASKHGGQLVNELFICSEDIALSPGYLKRWRIFKMTAVILGTNVLSELVFKAV